MANKVLLKKSSVAAKAPTPEDLEYGELAINYQDGKLYYKKANNTIDSFSSATAVSTVSSVDGSTGDITAQQLLDAVKKVDGSGSGLDADLLDGLSSASYAKSGANTDITSLGGLTGAIGTADYIDFDSTATVTPQTGRVWWEGADDQKTLNVGMADGVVQQVGQETYFRIKATAPITNGQVVMFTGTVGASGALTGAPATGLTPETGIYVMGVATQDIPLNGWGYVTNFGLVRGINTTGGSEGWTDGTILYYNPTVTGGLTKTIPTAPNPKVMIAAVVHAASNGSVFVRVSHGSVLGGTDGNVQFGTLANGNLISYNGTTSRWENVAQSTITSGDSDKLDGQHGNYYLDWTNTTNIPAAVASLSGTNTGDQVGVIHTGAAVSGGDTLYTSVGLLLHMDGADGGVTFTDNSQYNHTVSVAGVTTQVEVKQFGTASAQIATTTNSNKLQIAHHAALLATTEDFTIEGWVYFTSVSAAAIIYNKATGTSFYPYQVYLKADGKLAFRGFNNSNSLVYDLISQTTVQTNTWYFWQARRTGQTFDLAINGSIEATVTLGGTTTLYNSTGPTVIGNYETTTALPVIGYIDEVRFTKASRPIALQTAEWPGGASGDINTYGVDGDFFFDNNGNLYGPKTSGNFGLPRVLRSDTYPVLNTNNFSTYAQPLDADLTAIAGLAGTSGLLKKTATNTWTLDTGTYLTSNQTISITGDATGSGTTSIALTLNTVPTTKGGTGLTSFTAKGIVYASSTSALATSTGLQFDGTNLGIGLTPSGSYKLEVSGTAAATDFNSTSDRNKKKNITTIEHALTKVKFLRGVQFDWIETGKHSMGLIAQEVEEIIPEAVQGYEGNKTVSYGNLVGLLVEAIKEQQEQINELKARIKELR